MDFHLFELDGPNIFLLIYFQSTVADLDRFLQSQNKNINFKFHKTKNCTVNI